MTTENESPKRSPRGPRSAGKNGPRVKGRRSFEWDEVDDLQQEDLLLPARKVKRKPPKFEKIESTLTVHSAEPDPYAVKKTPKKPAPVTLDGEDLSLPSYGKILEEPDDEFSVFMKNAEKAEEREKNRRAQAQKKEAERRAKKAASESAKKNESVNNNPEKTDAASVAKKPEGERQNKGNRDRNRRSASNQSAAKNPQAKQTPNQNPLADFGEKIAAVREYGLARLQQMGIADSETEKFLSGLTGIEKIFDFINFLLHSSLTPSSPAQAAPSQRTKKSQAPAADSSSPSAEKFPEASERIDKSEKKVAALSEKRRTEPKDTGKTERPSSRSLPLSSEEAYLSALEAEDDSPFDSVPLPPQPSQTPQNKPEFKISEPRNSESERAEKTSGEPKRVKKKGENESLALIREKWKLDGAELSSAMFAMLKDAGYEAPTPIQSGTIPFILAGRDLMGQSHTGSGKTAAFMIPIIEKVEACPPGNDPVALVVVPTRELAVQIRDETAKLSRNREIITVACYGGKPIADQIKKMRNGVDILIGTPGRIIDLANRRAISLDHLRWVVLDEADRMLDIGFRPDIERILRMTPANRQTLLFSATLADPVVRLAQRYMRDPETVDYSENEIASETIEQFYLTVDRARKFEALTRLLKRENPTQAIIFCRTKRGVDKVAKNLQAEFQNVSSIHGDLTQSHRDQIMRSFRGGKTKLLVATDVIGRGIDVSGISHIINYDIPQFCDDYVHRVGRTGRMGREGVAFTLVTSEEGAELTRIEMRINRLLKRTELEGFEAFTRPEDSEKAEAKETKTVFGKPTRRIRRAL